MKLVCLKCGKDFYRSPAKVGSSKFCSKECRYSQTGECRKCVVCNDEFYVINSRLKKGGGKFCSIKCRGKGQSERIKGEGNPFWRGGQFMADGYIYIRHDGKYIGEHRLVMEQYLGRPLNSNEHVHHCNGNEADNCIENLEIYSASEHFNKHWKFVP